VNRINNATPVNYVRIPGSPLVMLLFSILASPVNKVNTASHAVKTAMTLDMFGKATHVYSTKDFELRVTLNGVNRFSKSSIQLLFQIFIAGNAQNWHSNTVRVSRAEMLKKMGVSGSNNTIDYYRKSSKKVLGELQTLSIAIATSTSKGKAILKECANTPLLTHASIKTGSGEISFSLNPDIVFSLSRYHHIFPEKALQIHNRHGILLAQLVYFRLAMSRTPGLVNVRNRDILAALGLPTDKKNVLGRRYRRDMQEPVIEAIYAINAVISDDLAIDFDESCDINTFLAGFITFRVINPAALEYYQRFHTSRIAAREKRVRGSGNTRSTHATNISVVGGLK